MLEQDAIATQLRSAVGGRPLLILTLSAAPELGGLETHISDMVRELSRAEVAATLLTYQPLTSHLHAPRREIIGTVEVRRVSWFGHGWFDRLAHHPAMVVAYLAPRMSVAAGGWLRRHPGSIVHAHGLLMGAVAGLARPRPGRLVVSTHHAGFGFGPLARRVAREALKGADQVLCLSEESVAEMRGLGLPPGRASRFQLWVDVDRFIPQPVVASRQRLGLDTARPVVLFVGRLLRLKGIGLLPEIAAARPDVEVVVVGDGTDGHLLEERADRLPNLRLVGPVPAEEMGTWYGAASVVIVPSQYDEGYGRVAIEAASSGRPVVASDRGGLKECVSPDWGRLVEPSAASFIEAIAAYVDDPELTLRAGEAAREDAVKRFGRINMLGIARAYAGGDSHRSPT